MTRRPRRASLPAAVIWDMRPRTLRPPRRPAALSAPRAALLAALLAGACAPACATTGATAAQGSAADEAERKYQRAMELFRDESWPEATEEFRALQRAHGTSRQAALAELRLADIEFRQEHYTEALSAFRAWLRYHPTHPEAPYARFMIARCHVEQMPDDWFLTPPSWERDLSSARDAETALARFVRDNARSEHAAEAQRLLRRVREVLARHEIYVANFYSSRERWNAAVSRLLGVVANFHDSGLEALALLRLGEVYLRTGRPAEARGAFTQLVEAYPRSSEVEGARRHLERLGPGPSTPVRPEAEAAGERDETVDDPRP